MLSFVVMKLKIIWFQRDHLQVFNAIINSSNTLSGSQKQIIVGPYPEFFLVGGIVMEKGHCLFFLQPSWLAVGKKLDLLETNSEERNT